MSIPKIPNSTEKSIPQQTSSVRLPGSLTRLDRFAAIREKLALSSYLPGDFTRLDTIRMEVESAYSLRPRSLFLDTNEYRIARPRQVAFYLARSMTRHSLPGIGKFFGRNHATVFRSILQVERFMMESEELRDFIAGLRQTILAAEARPSVTRITPGNYLPQTQAK